MASLSTFRRLVSVLAVTGLVLGLFTALAGPASADITAPANGAVLRGNATISASGASDGTLCANASGPQTTLQLINAGGGVVFESIQGGTGAKSATFDTHAYPNGTYTARAIERRRSGFVICSNNTNTTNRTVTIDNITQLSYSGATEAPQNTVATVRATLTDPNLAASVLPNRQVTFSLTGGTSVTATTNANGVATASLPISGPPRTATVTASFAETSFYRGSTASTQFAVTRNASTTTLVQPAAVVHGQATSFTAQVARVTGTSDPSGTVQFTVDGADFGAPVAVVDGVASSAPTTTLSTGSHTIGARYSGDGNLFASEAATRTQVVDKAGTTTALTSTGSPTVTGEEVTFTATVDVVAPGVGDPAGAVQFDVDGDPYGTAVPLDGSDRATLTIGNLPPGNHQVRATYNGNADFAASSSADLTHGVERAATTVVVATSNADAVAGEPLTFTAEVDVVGPGAGNPGGVVQFAADGEPIGDPVPLTGGTATSVPTGLDAGSHLITADYQGDDRFAGSSDDLVQVVDAAQTTTTVTTSPSPSVVGQPITVRAVVEPVAPATGQPGGVVQFTIDGQPGSFATLEDGAAEITVSDLTRGTHEITARYFSGDANFVTSTSEPTSHTVNKASTRTTVVSSSPVSVTGQPVTFTATVAVQAPGAGAPSGTITFTDGSTVLGTVPVSSATNGQASVTTADLGVGQHAIVATYDGDDSFNGSTGSVSQKVQRGQTSVLVTSSANPSTSGSTVRFTAEVSPVAPAAGEPTGTVRFTVNGANLGGAVAVVDGVATSAAFSSLSPGTYRIEATYSGDSRFVGSGGALDQGNGQTVVRGATTTTLESDDATSTYGDPVTFTATVAATGSTTQRPTGAVQFWEGGVLLGATSLVPAGPGTSHATFVSSTLAPGDHPVRAVYVGNFNFQGSEAQVVQTVGSMPTAVGVESSANPATFGDTVTLTAVVSPTLPGPGAPTGSVSFAADGGLLGTADVETVGGRQVAVLEVPALGAGDHEVVVTYGGDGRFSGSTSVPYLQRVLRAPVGLEAETVLDRAGANGGEFAATLTDRDGAPIAGQVLVFTTTQSTDQSVIAICEAVTDAQGRASCDGTSEVPATILDRGYDVRFEGNASYLPATDHGTYFVERP